jgi:hypothetical protein
MDDVAAYSTYRPHGETLNFMLDFEDPNPERLFSHAVNVCHCLAGVVRPSGFNLWLTCAIEETSVPVGEPEPSQPYWQVREQDSPTAVRHEIPAGLPFEVRTVPDLSDDALLGVFREAVSTATCDAGFVVTFEGLTPTVTLTHIADHEQIGADGLAPIVVYDQLFAQPTVAMNNSTWLDAPPNGAPYLPPITFTIGFDSILTASLSVHWSRWLDQGTGEHQALAGALTSMIKSGWRLHGESVVFDF